MKRAPEGRYAVLSLLLTLLGLLTLLIAPYIARKRVAGFHHQIDERLLPAHVKIETAITLAYQANNYVFSYSTILEVLKHDRYATNLEFYDHEMVFQWDANMRDDRVVAQCGEDARKSWEAGTADLTKWIKENRSTFINGVPEGGQDNVVEAATRFTRGIGSLFASRGAIDVQQAMLQRRIVDTEHLEERVTVPMVLVCLALAMIAWYNAQRLRASWTREQEVASRLEVAVKETNHRIKNNLQVIGALMDLHLQEPGVTVDKQALREIVGQVKAVAAVHDFLSTELRSHTIKGDRMLDKLVTLVAGPARLRIELDADEVPLTVKQATALALIVNELLLNAGKHGATSARVGLVTVTERVHLEVADNGPGFPSGFDPVAHANLGLALVDTLTRHDLLGEAAYHNSAGGCVTISFPQATE